MSCFSDEKILAALSFGIRYKHEGYYGDCINLKNKYTISLFAAYRNARLSLIFFSDKGTAGTVHYNLFNVPNCTDIGMSFGSSSFASGQTIMSAEKTMEILMEYPEIKDWLLWNHL